MDSHTIATIILVAFILWIFWPTPTSYRSKERGLAGWIDRVRAGAFESRFGLPYVHSRFTKYPSYHDFRKTRSRLTGNPGLAASFGIGRGWGFNLFPTFYMSNLHYNEEYVIPWSVLRMMDNGWVEIEATTPDVKVGDYILLPNGEFYSRLRVEGIEYVEGNRFYASCSIKLSDDNDKRQIGLFGQDNEN